MDRMLIANTTILDGSGAAPFPGDVLVEGQRIVAVQRGGRVPRGEARVIDGAGATLMPGLHRAPLTDIKCLQRQDALLAIMKDGQLHKAPAA